MRRPHWRSAMFTAASGVLGLAMLAGCTTQQSSLSASDQAARYLQNARGRYVIPGPPGDPWGPYIREASSRFDMPETWIRALMRQELGGNLYRNGQLIMSSAGAMGLMQVMPGTYAELRARHNLGPDPFDPHDNIMAGVAYMREMYDMYGSPGFLAAYNAGPNRLDDYLANQRGLPDETRRYVAAIGPSLRYAQPRVHSPAEQYAMNQLPLYIPPGPRFGYGTAQLPTVQLRLGDHDLSAAGVHGRAGSADLYPCRAADRCRMGFRQPRGQPPRRRRCAGRPPSPGSSRRGRSTLRPRPTRRRNGPWWRAPRSVMTTMTTPRFGATTSSRNPVRPAASLSPCRRTAPQRSGGGLHLISSAMAAEVYTTRHGRKVAATSVNYTRDERSRGHEANGAAWKLHASGPVQAAAGVPQEQPWQDGVRRRAHLTAHYVDPIDKRPAPGFQGRPFGPADVMARLIAPPVATCATGHPDDRNDRWATLSDPAGQASPGNGEPIGEAARSGLRRWPSPQIATGKHRRKRRRDERPRHPDAGATCQKPLPLRRQSTQHRSHAGRLG